MRNRLIPTSLLTLSLALAGTSATLAQDAPELEPEVPYVTGSVTGDIAGVVEPTEAFPAEGLREMRGLSIVGIPVLMDDPRLSGFLTFSANGSGQDFDNGFINIESRTYRLENPGGAWTGNGNYALAVTEDENLLDMESAVLIGDGDYAGLTAFLFAKFDDGNRAFEAVVIEGAPAPLPDPVPATAIEDLAAAD